MSRLDCFRHVTKVALASFLGLVIFSAVLLAQDNAGPELPPVPFGVTSFGAAAADGNVYLYGGHTGRPHSYSLDGISEKLLCLNTKSTTPEWKEVSTGPKLQGLALVEHKGKLYRIGGLTIEAVDKEQATEKASDEEEPEFSEDETTTKSGHKIYSVDTVALFDPASNQWQDLPPLPEPRSSHDAVVVNDTIYVFGGWSLADDNENWAEHGFSLDLSQDNLQWKTVDQPETCRRAVSVAALDDKIYLIGGMTDSSDILNEVVVYDIKTEKWESVEELPAEGRMAGFGNSSFAIGNKIYCLAYDGVLRAFSPASGKWSTVKESSARFFHRLLRLSDDQLVIVGGSDMKTGFVKTTEVYTSGSNNATAANKADSPESNSLDSKLSEIKSAEPEDYPKLIEDVIKQDVDRDELLKLLRTNVDPVPGEERTGNLKKGWSKWEATDENGETRPYQIYASEKIAAGAKPTAVIVHLHGAVARPDFGTSLGGADSVGYAGFLWPKVAEEHNYLIVCPLGRADCCWWLDAGAAHVKAVIRDVKRTLPVPDQAIYGAGFSDGASGCYYLSMVAPDPFAGFVAMNGHPSVASNASEKQLYLQNMRHTPFVAAMTQNDSLYPTRTLLPHLNMAIGEGAPIWLISYANANHQPTYFDDQTTTIVNFFKNNSRPETRDRIRWQASDISLGKVGWLEITEIGETEWDAPAWEDLNLMTTPGRVSIGIELESFASTKAKRVVPESAADSAGVLAGDTVLQLGETKLTGARDLRTALASFNFGQEFTCVVKRGDEEMTLSGKFPDFVAEQEYRRDDPAAQVDCRLTKEGKPRILFSSRNVKRARVWLTPDFTTEDEVDVVYGFKDKTESRSFPVVRLTPEQLLKRYAENPDGMTMDRYVDIEIQASK